MFETKQLSFRRGESLSNCLMPAQLSQCPESRLGHA